MNLSGMKQVVKFLLNNFSRGFLIRLSIALRPLFNFSCQVKNLLIQ